MSAVPERSPRVSPAATAYPSEGAVTLAELLDALGGGVLELVTAPLGLEVPVAQALLLDPQEPEADHRDGLVFGVGVDPAAAETGALLEGLAARRASVVMLKSSSGIPARLRATAQACGLAVLAIPREASWDQVCVLVRTSIAAAQWPHPAKDPEGVTLGNLFRLADAIAAMVGGPTTIEGTDNVVLAYSSGDAPIDLPRQQTILGHRVPEAWVQKLQDAGVFKRLLSGADVVTFHDPDEEMRPRLALAVRAGGELLGTIWVAEGSAPFTDASRSALLHAGSIAALHLIHHRHAGDLERSRKSETLRSCLRGQLPLEAVVRSIGMPAECAATLVAFQLRGLEGPELSLKAQRLVDLITLYCAAFRCQAGAVVLGDTVYLLLAEAEGHGRRAQEIAHDVVRRAGEALRAPVQAGLSRTAPARSEMRVLRQEADQALRILSRSEADRDVAAIDDLRSQAFLLELQDYASLNPSLLEGRLRLLVAEDARRGTTYVETLRAYLEHFGDVPAAAASIPIHANTFRYRLRRLSAFAGIDLEDPDERLVLHLQLRLLD